MEYDTEKGSTFKKAKSLQKSLSLKKTKNKPNLLQDFTAANPDLREIYIDECLSDNDELHLLKVPTTFDSKLLVGNVINFDDKTKLKIENIKYIVEPSKEDSENVLILSKKPKLINSTLILRKKRRKNRNINLQEEPDLVMIEDEQEPVKKKKKRKIEEPSLDLFPPVVIDLTENGKQKMKKTGEVKRYENKAVFDLLESYSTDQKKKNSKNREDKVPIAQEPDAVETSINNFIDSLSSKKKKKKLKNNNETNPIILQNILLSPSHGNESNERIVDEQSNIHNSSVQKKKKKRSSDKLDKLLENIVTDLTPKKKKTKKASHETSADSTKLINEEKERDNIDVTDRSFVAKEKKKTKLQNTQSPKPNLNISNKAQQKSTNLNDVSATLFSSPKRNKDEKNILIAEILNSVKKEIHLFSHDRKRRKSVM